MLGLTERKTASLVDSLLPGLRAVMACREFEREPEVQESQTSLHPGLLPIRAGKAKRFETPEWAGRCRMSAGRY